MQTNIKTILVRTLCTVSVVVGFVSAANIDPIPNIATDFAVVGKPIQASDMNDLAESVTILDSRTNNFKDTIIVTDDRNVGI